MSLISIEEEAKEALIAAGLSELSEFNIDTLADQVDLDLEEFNRAVPHVLIATSSADFSQGLINGDVINLYFVVIVPGVLAKDRRQSAMNAIYAIREWMADPVVKYMPLRAELNRLYPVAVVVLSTTVIG